MEHIAGGNWNLRRNAKFNVVRGWVVIIIEPSVETSDLHTVWSQRPDCAWISIAAPVDVGIGVAPRRKMPLEGAAVAHGRHFRVWEIPDKIKKGMIAGLLFASTRQSPVEVKGQRADRPGEDIYAGKNGHKIHGRR